MRRSPQCLRFPRRSLRQPQSPWQSRRPLQSPLRRQLLLPPSLCQPLSQRRQLQSLRWRQSP